MGWLGVRCWKDRLSLVVVEDGDSGPSVTFQRRQKAPKRTENHGTHVAWFHRMTLEAIEEVKPEGVAIRVANSGAEQVRSECEGAVAVAAAQSGLPTKALRQQSMWKPLGVENSKAETWKRFLREDPVIGSLVADEQEAASASLAAARR